MNGQQAELHGMPRRVKQYSRPCEFKVVPLRECGTERDNFLVDTPETARNYWRAHVTESPSFRLDCENMVVLLLNTRRRVKGHVVISNGTLDTLLVHPLAVFRPAVIAQAAAIILMHNHPSGDPSPSESDIKVTRDLMRAGQLLKCEVLDHVIIGDSVPDCPKDFCSLRELGYLAT